MSGTVFANGEEVSAKQSDNQSIAAMPDVCLSPPSPPAGPIPIPYPNFSQASDTTDGTKTVKIAGDEVGMKNQSSYKTSKGDEAATKTLGMGTVTATIQGKTFFAAWSSDVMFEGANAVRFMDMTTHNHANPQNSGAAIVNGGKFSPAPRATAECSELQKQNEAAQAEKHPVRAKRGDDPVLPEGRTFASAHYTPPTGGSYTINSSSHMSDFTKKNGWAHGYKDDNGDFKDSKLCADAKKKFQYSGQHANQGPMAHAESRIVETLLSQFGSTPGGTLVLRIQQSGEDGLSSRPCKSCHDMLCAAGECLNILLCKGKTSQPQPMENCPE